MSELHYFPRYSQPENVVTNNTLLLLLRFREYNRFKFEKLMEAICSDQEIQLASSWLQFRQQMGTGKSVVDGFIAQDSVKIAVETKLAETFDAVQLTNHLAVFGAEQHKLLILLSPSLGAHSSQQLASIREHAAPRNIQVVHTSFEEIVEKARNCLSTHEEEMVALVNDYEAFCSYMDLLPRDKYTIFVPPCGQSFDENTAFRLYYCPVTWTRRNAKYLGIYKDKCVRAIGGIAKVVACNVDIHAGTVTVQPGEPETVTAEEQARIIGASRAALERDWDLNSNHKFFLCDTMVDTVFRKTSPGGIMGHRYFDLQEVLGHTPPSNINELAERLKQHSWE
ncbi:hypothetical protein [Bradyrhizobium sp. PRIMUS42]|uniref:hypothetical protein n=1 Tax=Bradyrhizobium sp. PRIMUS42 TaxID=2908926 RepID=UPI001FF2C982|nr:hypothetical protein [Bradyrhizobium sp. PRIMUS42]MCJ9728979.1 hypothetical protein [Bradyrhizobium sp. PRIMUS42]